MVTLTFSATSFRFSREKQRDTSFSHFTFDLSSLAWPLAGADGQYFLRSSAKHKKSGSKTSKLLVCVCFFLFCVCVCVCVCVCLCGLTWGGGGDQRYTHFTKTLIKHYIWLWIMWFCSTLCIYEPSLLSFLKGKQNIENYSCSNGATSGGLLHFMTKFGCSWWCGSSFETEAEVTPVV